MLALSPVFVLPVILASHGVGALSATMAKPTLVAQNADEVIRPRSLPRNMPVNALRDRNRQDGANRSPPPTAPNDDPPGDDTSPPPTPAQAPATPSPSPPPSTPSPSPSPSSVPAKRQPSDVDVADRQKNGKFNFEFSKADIMDVVKAISNLTQRNFIIPEKIKSQKITILSPGQISASEAYSVFLAALESNGITLVRSGRFYKLVESKEAIKSPIPTCINGDDECPQNVDQMVTQMIRLNYVDGQQLNNVLKSLIGKDGDIQLFQPSNAVIISDYARNLQRIRRIIDSLDVPGFQDELQIVEVEYATASEIADKITQIFEVQGRGATASANRPAGGGMPRPNTPPGPDGGNAPPGPGEEADVQISKIVPDDRTNQIIIKANKRSFDAIRRLIAKLDIPVSDVEQGRVHVYYLENASAEELSSTLSSLASGQPSSSRSGPGGGNRNGPAPPGGASAPASQPRQGPETATLFEGDLKITADKATNSLLVLASGRDFRSLRKIIEQLDIPRRQVYVEAAIMEVSIDNSGSYGTNWHLPATFGADDLPGGIGGPGSLGFIQNPGNGDVSPTLTDLSDPSSLLSIANGSIVGLVGKSVTIPVGDNSVTLPSFGIILKALQTSSNVQVLSTPHILTMDNEEATIEVGRKVPFRSGTSLAGSTLSSLTGSSSSSSTSSAASSASSLYSSVQRIDVTLKLTVTPQINESDRIRLEIDQDVQDVASTDPSTQTPITSKRQAKTTVVVDDQQTIIIGGLMRDNTTEGESKIPVLGDIPLLGWLFKTRTTSTQKINLILVLTPYIVRNAEDFQNILERKVREYEEFAAEYYGSTPKYRAFIDYKKKSGPFARLAQSIAKAKERAETGTNDQGDMVIAPNRKVMRPGHQAPGEDDSVPHGENLLEEPPRGENLLERPRKTVPQPVREEEPDEE